METQQQNISYSVFKNTTKTTQHFSSLYLTITEETFIFFKVRRIINAELIIVS